LLITRYECSNIAVIAPKRTPLITKYFNVAVSGLRIFPYTRSKEAAKEF